MPEFTKEQKALCDKIEKIRTALLLRNSIAQDTLKKLLDAIYKINFGVKFLDLLKDSGALIAEAAKTVAAQVASVAAAAASRVASVAMEILLKYVLTILMLGPGAIIGLVAMPIERAKVHGRNERKYLLKARSSINTIVSLFLSLIDFGQDSGKYILQMRAGLQILNRVIKDLTRLMERITSDGLFDSGLYNRSIRDLENTIAVTQLQNPISRRFREKLDDKKIERRKDLDVSMRKEIKRVNQNRQRELSDLYNSRLTRISQKGDTALEDLNDPFEHNFQRRSTDQEKLLSDPTYIAKSEAINRKAEAEIDSIKFGYAALKEVSDAKAYSIGLLAETWKGSIDEKSMIIGMIISESQQLLSHMQNAFLYYQKRAAATRGAHIMAGKIKPLIRFILTMLKKAAGDAEDATVDIIKGALVPITSARDSMQNEVDNYDGGSILTALYLASKLLQQNGQVQLGHSLLNAMISTQLIDLINSDNIFGNFADDVEKMQKDIKAISTFYSEDPWIDDMASAPPRLSPYIKILTQIGSIIARAPGTALGSTSQRQKLQSELNTVNSTIGVLITHNYKSTAVLAQYEFPIHPSVASLVTGLLAMGAGNIMALLEAGLLVQAFTQAGKGYINNFAMCAALRQSEAQAAPLNNSALDSENVPIVSTSNDANMADAACGRSDATEATGITSDYADSTGEPESQTEIINIGKVAIVRGDPTPEKITINIKDPLIIQAGSGT